MKKILSVFSTILIILLIFPFPADSYELTGRISSDLYAYQGSNDDHIRPYLRFRANMLAWRAEDGRSLRFHTSLRWTSDFADKLTSDPELFVYDAYAHLSGLPTWTDVYVGRQFVYTGVGSALMDGGRLHFRRAKNLSLNVFGGSSVSSEDPDKVRSLDDDLVLGGHFIARPDRATKLGLSWMLRRRDGDQSFHRVGIDVDRLFGPAEIYGRVSYNAADLRLAEILTRAVYRPGAWYVSGEYGWREPFVASNSIFALIDFKEYRIGRVEARRRVWRQLSVLANVQADLSSDEDAWRTGIGVSTPLVSVSWIHQTGYAGDNDGVSGHVNVRLNDRLDCYASANLFRYRVQQEQVERSDAYASTAGLRWRPGWGVTIVTEGQYLRNAVLKDDSRFLLRISKDFSISSKNG
ncbi:MAG: hypothetical protein GTO29_03910 [Candidatus Latescibacteria bacterium]|nr:hypothetical protein [Candidatus Latescibacterota bacterium]NIO55221.1 hypothetical protein [Candidatus Latescibacterota bacterium]